MHVDGFSGRHPVDYGVIHPTPNESSAAPSSWPTSCPPTCTPTGRCLRTATVPCRCRPFQGSAGRNVEPATDLQPAPVAATEVLTVHAVGLRVLEERSVPPGGTRTRQGGSEH